jgi:hypothetical protein
MGPPWVWALPLLPLPQSWMRLGLGLPIFRGRHGRDRGSERNSQSMVLYIWNPTPRFGCGLGCQFFDTSRVDAMWLWLQQLIDPTLNSQPEHFNYKMIKMFDEDIYLTEYC